MRIAEVIGRLTLNRSHPLLEGAGARFIVAVPLSREDLFDRRAGSAEEVVAFDPIGAGEGALIGLSEGREAANPFGKTMKPIDAYCACILDELFISNE